MVGAKRKLSRAEGANKSARTEAEQPTVPEDPVEMYSDEDMEGGFEDLEDGDDGDEPEDQDMEDDEEEDGHVQGAPSKLTEPSESSAPDARFSVPSLEEIHGLKETSELYMNNMFKLQLDEMMRQIRPDFEHAQTLEQALRRMHKVFDSLPSLPPQSLPDALSSLERLSDARIVPPFADPKPREEAAYKFSFEKPSNIHLVGSWPLRTAARRPGELDVDVEVCMPSALFQEKDTFNARYFHKRAFYLAVIASALQKDAKLGMDVEFMDPEHNGRSTCLVLRARDTSSKEFRKFKTVIRVHAAHELGLFPLGRLAPNRNSLRGAIADAEEGSRLAPTPQYNSSLVADSLRMPHLLFLHSTAEACAGFAEASQLLKTWATQRGFGSLLLNGSQLKKYPGRQMVAGSENTRFMLTMLLAHLLHGDEPSSGLRGRTLHAQRPKLSFGYNSYQLMRGVFDFLAKHPWATSPVYMRAQPRYGLASHAEQVPPTSFSAASRVLVDPSGCVNLLAAWPAASVDLLQQEAAQTLHMLNDAESDCFRALFLTPRTSPVETFDEAGVVTLSTRSDDTVRRLDAGSARAYAIEHMLGISATALGSRAWNVAVSYSAPATTWALSEEPPALSRKVEFGVRLNAEHAWRQVEHGPPPEDAVSCTSFRAFWGDVAELRRFRDGRVLESVVWPVSNLDERTALPRRVLQHALLRHGCITKPSKLQFVNPTFDGLLDVKPDLAHRAYLKSPLEVGFSAVQGAYDVLVKQLRAMDDLPLSVIGVQPVAQALRSMSTFAPGPLNLAELGSEVPDCASYLPVHPLLLTLESSGRWPDDLGAIQEMKAALYERMAAVLGPKLPGAIMRVVYDRDAEAGETIQDQSSLQITLPAGFAFSCRIHHDREHHLLERLVRSSSGAARRRAQDALTRYDQRFVHAAAHHAALQALYDQYPSLGTTVRLVERWVSAQMLSTQVPVEAIELLAVAVYTSSAHTPPATGVAGLVRVLTLLRDWHHRETVLIVPLEAASRRAHEYRQVKADADRKAPGTAPADLRHITATSPPVTVTSTQRVAAEQAFRAARARDPAIHHSAWSIATDLDESGSLWTHEAPSVTIADALRQLADRAVAHIESPVVQKDETMVLFTPSLKMYDFVLHLDPAVHTRYAESLQPDSSAWLAKDKRAFKNLRAVRPSLYGNESRPGWDPVGEYVELLQSLYPGIFHLFYDHHGGTAIGGVWDNAMKKPHPFKVMLGYSSRPESKSNVVLNTEAILSELARLGFGLVKKVEVSST
ncbi:U3 snoRNP protein [Malassezia obtusa]|uniref:U3 small nucleolar RNA-associated protein 22 n=1 Tax=Malassezia obtusa TaxID=76774 RepID=A0AAF0IQB7_9BASI|nr:U3 snoRNP protein [Malassezia obtusa]